MKNLSIIFLLFMFPLFGHHLDFQRLNGKGTSAWEYVRTKEDFSRIEFFETLFKKNIHSLDLSLEKSEASKIPKVIHFIWLGSNEISEQSLKKMKQWKRLHPHFQFKFWTDRDDKEVPFDWLQKKPTQDFAFEFLSDFFYLSDNLGEKAKILAYEILYQEGGICVELDVKPTKSFDLLNDHFDFYCGLQQVGPSIFSSSVFAAVHLIGAKPKHPILKESMLWIQSNWKPFSEAYLGPQNSNVMNRIKYRTFFALSAGIDKAIDQTQNCDIVFPSSFFSLSKRKASSYAIHVHEGAWNKNVNGFEGKMKRQFEELMNKDDQTIILILVLSAASFCGWLFLWTYVKSTS